MSDPTTEAPEAPEIPEGEAVDETASPPEGPEGDAAPSVEDLLNDLEAVTGQRDEYLAVAQARQAEFENFRKRVMKQHTDDVARATGRLVEHLLPVLDAFDDGVRHGVEGLLPMRGQLLAALEKEGLERLDPTEQPFDPNEHDAVAHEPGEGGEHVVAETLRAGYRWNGSLLRPAMVKVRD